MKTLLSCSLLIISLVSGWAQGTVDFRNSQANYTTQADRLVRNTDGSPLVGTNFLVQLYYNVGADMNNVNTMIAVTNPPVFFRAEGTALPGTWTGGGSRALQGVAPGTSTGPGGMATLQVRVWDYILGRTWEEAQQALLSGAIGKFGASLPFNYQVPPAGSTLPAFYMDNLRGFTLVPEPGLSLLGFVAGLSWVLWNSWTKRTQRRRSA